MTIPRGKKLEISEGREMKAPAYSYPVRRGEGGVGAVMAPRDNLGVARGEGGWEKD